MDVELTKSAKRSIASVYREYQLRLKRGEPKSAARFFDETYKNYDVLRETINDDVSELKSAQLIQPFIVSGFKLTDAGIIFMENKTKEIIKEWLSFSAQFIP